VILVGDQGAEDRLDAIAPVLVHGSLEMVHAACEDLEEAVHYPIPLLRIDLLAEVHRTLEIREEDGHLLPLAFEGAAGRENLLGEVLRRVQTWIGNPLCNRRRLERPPAAVAEARTGRIFVATRRAGHVATSRSICCALSRATLTSSTR
jgi:hypothetical protein